MNVRNILWRKRILVILAFVLLLGAPIEARADIYWPDGPRISSPSAIVIEVNSGAILYEKNADQTSYPASITKVLTAMLVLENCELNEVVTFSDDAINLNQGDTSHIFRDYGEQMTVEECLYAVMLESANECAYALAEHVAAKLGGDYEYFVELMNERAKELGCTNTNFVNCNGLPDKNHWTSARDMALISANAYKNETFKIIGGTRRYQIPPTNKHKEITYLNNHHGMISDYKTVKHLYSYCTGGKTGFTEAAGCTLVSFAEKDGMTLACVLMKTTVDAQYEDSRALFEYCFQNFQTVSIASNDATAVETEQNTGILKNHLPFIHLEGEAYIVLPMTANIADVEKNLEYGNLLGDVIAQLQYSYGGHQVGIVDIISSGAKVEDNYFENAKAQEQQSEINVIRIKPSLLAMVLVLSIIAGVIIVYGKRLYDNYYVILHDLSVKKQRKARFKPITHKKKKWRKKDRMFK